MQFDQFQLLRCPEDRTPLAPAPLEVVDDINRAIREGRLTTVSGKRVEQVIDGGLVRAAGDILYPIVEKIPVLLRDEAITLQHFRREAAAK
jgi:uncharacterized protein YbaR (Trm112 family)